MKKILVILFFMSYLKAYSQASFSFIDSNITWRNYYWYGSHNNSHQYNFDYSDEFNISGDTAIGSFIYKKIG